MRIFRTTRRTTGAGGAGGAGGDAVSIRRPVTPAERRRRRWRTAAVASTAVGALVAAVVVAVTVFGPDGDRCGEGVVRRDGDCVGITDGSYVLEPQLRVVEGRIEAENARVGDQPHVTVALMASLTTTGGGLVPIKRIRSQLEGAYLAQRLANESGVNPKLKLVLANKGSREQAWQEVTDQLLDLTGEPDHLVGVVGPGLSTVATARGIKVLTDHGIPVVGTVITADNLNALGTGVGGPFRGVVKVNVNVSDELSVLADHLREHRPDLRTAMLVSDSNPDDLYTRSLQENFTRGELAEYWVASGRVIQPYDGRSGTPGTNAQFRAIVANLCGENSPDLVFYAGRALLLPDFVQGLRERSCARGRTITVVSGSDASALADTLDEPRETDAPVSVIYTPLAAPTALADPKWNPELAQYQRFETAFVRENHFDPGDLSDGWAIMTHDAVLAARLAVERVAGQERTIPTPEDVAGMLPLLNSPSTAVPGAAGTFTFDTTSGNVRGRRLHVLELRPDATLAILGVYPQPAGP